MNNLPIELWSLVFEHHQNQTLEEPNGQLAEIVVSHVCSAWRSIAIGHPKLWSWYAYRNEKRHKQEFERLVVYLQRSSNHPLHLWFVLRSYLPGPHVLHHKACPDSKEARAISLFQKAKEHAHRWRCISIDIVGEPESDHGSSTFFAPLRNLSLPELETFEVYMPHLSNNVYLNNLLDSKQLNPKLWFVRVDPISFLKYIPPHSITTLELHRECMDPPLMPGLLEALWEVMASPMLTTVSIIGEMYDDESTKGFFTKRKRLSPSIINLRCSSINFSRALFRHVQFPRLEVLCFREISLGSLFEDVQPIDQALKTLPRLRTLILLNCESTLDSYIISLSQYTQSIRHLFILQDPDFVEEDPFDHGERSVFFKIVDKKILSRTSIWPDLDTITFSRPLEYYFSPEQIESCIDIVQSRHNKCMLRVPRYNAERWQSENPALWSSLSATGKLEIIPADANKSIGRWLPWPSREPQGIKRPPADMHNAGDPFLHPVYSEFEDEWM